MTGKIVAQGSRWLAEIEPHGPLFLYRFRSRTSTTWDEARASNREEAVAAVTSRLGDAGLLGWDELIKWTNPA